MSSTSVDLDFAKNRDDRFTYRTYAFLLHMMDHDPADKIKTKSSEPGTGLDLTRGVISNLRVKTAKFPGGEFGLTANVEIGTWDEGEGQDLTVRLTEWPQGSFTEEEFEAVITHALTFPLPSEPMITDLPPNNRQAQVVFKSG